MWDISLNFTPNRNVECCLQVTCNYLRHLISYLKDNSCNLPFNNCIFSIPRSPFNYSTFLWLKWFQLLIVLHSLYSPYNSHISLKFFFCIFFSMILSISVSFCYKFKVVRTNAQHKHLHVLSQLILYNEFDWNCTASLVSVIKKKFTCSCWWNCISEFLFSNSFLSKTGYSYIVFH